MEIRLAADSDLRAVKRIADMNKASLGFLPRPVFEQGIFSRELIVALAADTVCGFIHFHIRKDNILKIYQICIDERNRRLGIGSLLVRYLISSVGIAGVSRIVLRCPEELDANEFYLAFGFSRGEIVKGKKRRLQSWYIQLESKL